MRRDRSRQVIPQKPQREECQEYWLGATYAIRALGMKVAVLTLRS